MKGPEKEQRYRSTLSFTSALNGEWVNKVMTRLLYSQVRDTVRIAQEAGWAPGPIWTGTENLTSNGIRSPDSPVHSTKSIILNVLSWL